MMSKYTTIIKNICDARGREDVIETFSSYDLDDYLTPKQKDLIINSNVWNKAKLANKIIDYYYFREIGFETYGLFKHYAKIEMEVLMEHYLPMIYSRCIEYDPLVNVDYSEIYTATSRGNNTAMGESSSNSKSQSNSSTKFSDTPNVGLDNVSGGKYITNANFGDTESGIAGSAKSNNSVSSVDSTSYTKNIKGNSGVSATAQKMVQQFRDNIIAIDRKIIEELNKLFMGVY